MDAIRKGVQEVVTSLYSQYGEVKPSALVEAARSEGSPAHRAFEWDDSKAGEEYRLMQARQWIRRVEIIIEDRKDTFVHVPRIVIDKENQVKCSEGYYKPLSEIVKDKGEFEAAFEQTKGSLQAAIRSYEIMKKAAGKADKKRVPNFKKADKGFGIVRTALNV